VRADFAFTVAAPRAWNSLLDSLYRLSSLEQFKKLSKTHLKFHLRIKIMSNCKAFLKQLVLPTALYKFSKLHYITYPQEKVMQHAFRSLSLTTFLQNVYQHDISNENSARRGFSAAAKLIENKI